MHKIDLRMGTGLFVSCPACKCQNRITGSKYTRVIMAFSSMSEDIQGVCSSCSAPLVWSPEDSRVAPLETA